MRINKRRVFLRLHRLAIRFGYYILPVHYHVPVPNIIELERTRDVWARKSELPGLLVDLDEQASTLRAICLPYQEEYAGNVVYQEAVRNHFGPGYGYIEAQALHAVVRHYKPRRVIEVGSGVSTYCMWKACEMNCDETRERTTITCIEPYPSARLRALSQIELIPKQVQTVALQVFGELDRNDLLFIDSSHTVKPGSDVNYLILEVLPRLRPGVIVHFHDIYWPYDYQRDLCRTYFHWTESSLLRAFLIFNPRVRILACLSHLHYERQNILKEVFPEYDPQDDVDGLLPDDYPGPFELIPEHFPSSTYLQMM